MKVLFTFGGLPHYHNPILNKLNKVKGLEIVVVVPETGGKTLGKGVHESTQGIEFKVIRLPEYKPFYGKSAFKGLSKVIKAEKPDAIVTLWPYALAFLFNPFLLKTVRNLNIKLIYKDIPFNIPKYEEAREYYSSNKMMLETLGDNSTSNKYINRLKYDLVTLTRKWYFNLMDAHVYYSPDAFEIIGSYGVKKEKIFITYNSIDSDSLLQINDKIKHEPPILPPNPHRILHVGRLVKWKRVDLLINVLSRLKKKHEDSELVIIGTGPEFENLQQQVKDKNLESSVTFVGAIYDPEILGKYFLSSSLYVLAGMGGLSINEAMCFGKPVICSIADGTEKILVNEDYNGKYFINGSEDDLYEKINYMFDNPELIKQFGENSLDIIKNKINIHTVIKGYLKAFNYVSEGKYHLTYEQ